MAVGFGFSIGDLFAALRVIKDSVEAVHDTRGSAADYESLVKEIICLQDGLEVIEELQQDHALTKWQHAALERALYACQETVDKFLASISEYQPHLYARAAGLKSHYRKVKWALCKKDDVAKFRSQIGRHASSISMLLITFQARTNLGSGTCESSLIVKTRNDDEHITEMLKGLSIDQRHLFMAMTQQNKQLMQSIDEMRAMLHLQNTIPPQVLLQQPVILLDPFGKTAPFHLDFVDSAECFIAVLKARFSKAGVTSAGLSKLENQDFLIQDSRRKRSIDLNRNWSSVFRPGQNVEMSMIFHRFSCPPSTCPACLQVNEDDGDEQIYCQSCGLCYQNVQASKDWNHLPPSCDIRVTGEEIPYILRQSGREPEIKVFRPTRDSEDETFEGYRRVQLISQPLDLLDIKYPALQLIEDFSRFAELLNGVPDDASAFLPNLRVLHGRAIQLILQQRSSFPPFASFSQIEQVREDLAQESSDLRRDIDILVQHLYNDPDTTSLMKYIKETYSSNHGRNYYTGVLTRMANHSDFAKSGHSKVRSAERMQWLLLDSKSK